MPPLGLCLVLIVVIWGGLRTEPFWSIAEAVINNQPTAPRNPRSIGSSPGPRDLRLPGVAPFAARAGSRPREPVVFRAEPSFAGTFFGGMIAGDRLLLSVLC